MFSENRDEIRRFIFTAWQKYCGGEALAPLEHLVATVAARHPEYHRHLESEAAALAAGTETGGDSVNPFLHLGMHIALEEQLRADRPAGIRAVHHQLVGQLGDAHVAEHRMAECLGAVLREAGRAGMQPDEERYLACLQRLAGNS